MDEGGRLVLSERREQLNPPVASNLAARRQDEQGRSTKLYR